MMNIKSLLKTFTILKSIPEKVAGQAFLASLIALLLGVVLALLFSIATIGNKKQPRPQQAIQKTQVVKFQKIQELAIKLKESRSAILEQVQRDIFKP